ncbi:Conserved protein containing a Zn-ribbon-like motif, possibly RNA-binding [Tistlia consotensis]|uniref:Conserved protein containing a Zn-ribbon-like motif, possibly RNA-binding n=1 Tax=Tistlia consotensis USBA 355 TaxID=560819 RepID=A0A1Y6BC74_9PROT|nr:ABATE domain-containing protein [Tistlia consotensis]SMF02456.1 Conserved protein containing a Zn-ribbon-like motif, possibly RNA-binding [Tistlia consotensis USBA 355]SNR52836.1 Conserved protein containing a Zn-ribbon-like motif, possibly RNA-binding [Tistlia consotensis]
MTEPTTLNPEDWDFHFRAGRLCLDFLATVGDREGLAFDRWRRPADLGRWCLEAGVLAEAPAVSAGELAEARGLREAIHRVLRAALEGARPEPADLALLNERAGRPDPAPQLAAVGRRAAPVAGRPLEAALAAVARDAVALFAEGPLERVRQCAADDCSVWFLDSSRPGRRRWCSMAGCGNREKKAAFRGRAARPGR